VEGLGKQYRIGRPRGRRARAKETVGEALAKRLSGVQARLRAPAASASKDDSLIWALRDVSLDIEYGEAVGIIGGNGAGKSTLLKILSRITDPTTGLADLYGRVGSLLEVGTGFHPELTGRENIYLNGAIMGMRRREIEQRFDEIVAFSEVEQFIETPVKHYSSGMYLRLAFAVAAHLEPEILLVDEVLAVGDAAFQRKCLGKMGSVARQGRTVLFVSHNMGAISQLCNRAFWLANGQVRLAGPATDVVAAYLAEGTADQSVWRASAAAAPGQEVLLEAVRVLDEQNEPAAVIHYDCAFQVEIASRVLTPIRNLSVSYQVLDAQENVVFEAMDTDQPEWKGRVRPPGNYLATCLVPASLLKPGRYSISLAAFVERVKIIDRQARVVTFDVSEIGYPLNARRQGVIAPVLPWRVAAPASNGTHD
jgi:lipopolysaccharide transport system ATP-binding protein